jgi:uncharacterized protein (TIGR03000 family)
MLSSSLPRRVALMLLVALTAAPALRGQAPDQQDRRAWITLRVDPRATVTVDGQPTQLTGGVRRFYSPPLEPGKKYSYTFVVKWPRLPYEEYRATRKVSVEAGKRSEIDVSKPDVGKGDTLVIIFVRTPPKVIEAMMKLAKVGKDDVVYDLGCGTGEIVITAVKQFDAKRGVGIDIEAGQVEKARANAKRAGVEDKVEFRQGDVLKVKDLDKATVVTLYVSEELNKLLLPILKKQLKPGTRIVSHRFTMGDLWKPDKTETVNISLRDVHDIAEERLIHLWTIPKKEDGKNEKKNHSGK